MNLIKKLSSIFPVYDAAGMVSSSCALLCCTIPSLFVFLGFGSLFFAITDVIPQITWFTRHSTLVFSVAGAFIVVNALLLYKRRNLSCPIKDKEKIEKSRKLSKRFFIFSVIAYLLALFAKFCYFLL